MHNTHHYVDRGIIKLAPFDALVGYGSMIHELKYRMGQSSKPILSDDQYETLNQHLHVAYHHQLEVMIEYFFDGYIKETFGFIRKIDWVHKKITLSTFETLDANNVIAIYT